MVIKLQHMDIITSVSAPLKWKTSAYNVKNMTSWQISFTQPGELPVTFRYVLDLGGWYFYAKHVMDSHYRADSFRGLPFTYHVPGPNELLSGFKDLGGCDSPDIIMIYFEDVTLKTVWSISTGTSPVIGDGLLTYIYIVWAATALGKSTHYLGGHTILTSWWGLCSMVVTCIVILNKLSQIALREQKQ